MCKVGPAFLLTWLMSMTVAAQDPQFSQFYAAPLYLNPAFAGSTGQARVGTNYRNQWPAIDANFNTISAFADFFIEDKKSGVGFILNRDREGLLGLQSTSFGAMYSYELNITKKLSFRPGFQASIYNRAINFDKLTFGDQFDPTTGQVVSRNSVEGLNSGQSKFFPDFTMGGLFYSKNGWLGVTASHITQPNQSLVGSNDPLPMKLSGHVGWKFYLTPGVMGQGFYNKARERSITPTMQYRHQGRFDQMDLGVYYTFEPLIIGTWYRGVPFKNVNGIVNNESIVLLVGFTKKGDKDILNIGYSYDYTISKLGPASGGAHEFSIVYSWSMRDPRKPPPDKLFIPCPNF
ncbi:MAG: type IX secretion system membrane protein PorP/SprF [Bacteroidetes bacterium]|nr:type IX secretion system membrane protein PorP/SprF [Bacteroidota bacterium]MBS1541418.1 type IX secretion system membrane protein PorP/SprF [Bacteroidota bacterium]